MTNGIPITIIQQIEAAILGAFEHDELWRATRPMGDLHDHVTHASFAVEVTELVDWVGKRNRTVELLEHLHTAIPGNVGLQTAKDDYIVAAEEAQKNGPSAVHSFADTPAAPRTTRDTAKKGPQAPPWAWMAVGALVLLVLAFVFLGGEDDPSDTDLPVSEGDTALLDRLYDECSDGSMAACDSLFELSDVGSEDEEFAATCGGRLSEWVEDTCVADLGE